MKRIMVGMLLLMFAATALPTWAAHPKNINQRQQHQQNRIQQGVQSGSLTPKEANALATQERLLNQKEQRYRADGKLTPKERRDLQTDLNQLNRKIHTQKHDAQHR